MTDEAWPRLAGAVRQRRDELGLTQAELAAKSGVSEPTIRVIETARRSSYQRATLRAVAQALAWTPDSIDRILRGEGPQAVEVEIRPGEPKRSLTERVAEIERILAQLLEEKEAEEQAGADKAAGREPEPKP